MMENRSFDHVLGWLPGADGKQSGLSYKDHHGTSIATHHLTDFQGCAHPDPDHSYEGGRVQLNKGRCDGFLVSGQNDEFAIGYYTADDLPFTSKVASEFCTLDRYFAATMAETYPNRFYQHSAATDRLHNSYTPNTDPTIWDRLAAKGVSAGYYYNDLPFVALFGSRYLPIAKPFDQFLSDAEEGKLPSVSFVDPKFTDEGGGTSEDDHPHGDMRAGQYFLNRVYEALSQGPGWDRTVMVINYDEWGGFFDHVVPTVAPDKTPKQGTGLRGFRVPALVISPFARRGSIGHEVYDHTSVLKMIEWRWDLAPLTPRDKAARNLAEVLDLRSEPNLDAPTWSVPKASSAACNVDGHAHQTAARIGADERGPVDLYAEWRPIRRIADRMGFPAPVLL
jgi:phospholipase C